MLQNERAVLLVIGAVFFLIGLLGGGVEVSAVKIPTISRFPRLTFLLVGASLLGLALYWILFPGKLGSAVAPGPAPSANLSATQTPSALPADSTATSTPDLTPTASATPPAAANIVFSADFETDTGAWVTGEQSLSSSTEKKTISYGKYVWELTAGQSVFSSELPDAPVVSDFELQAELRLVSGPEDAAFGLIFRSSEKGVYTFNIKQGAFWLAFLDRQTNAWDYPTELIASSAINQNGPNVLKVAAKGSNIQLFINGEFVRTVSDSRSLTGKTGISVSLYNAEDSAKLEVDDFYLTELRE